MYERGVFDSVVSLEFDGEGRPSLLKIDYYVQIISCRFFFVRNSISGEMVESFMQTAPKKCPFLSNLIETVI